jgi:glyoxylase-like metal-dependent hydrolase (beta-lactamase superfamily II)
MIRQLFFPGLLDTSQVHDGIFAIRDGFVNLYILKTAGGLICIDTGWNIKRVCHGFETLGIQTQDVVAVYLTHLHWDHSRNLNLFPNADIFVGEHEFSRCFPKWLKPSLKPFIKVRDGQELTANNILVRVIETPGHTIGSVSYLVENRFLFTGDVLRLRRGEARPFHFYFNRNHRAVIHSIHRLSRLEGIQCLLTAHTGLTCNVAASFRRWREGASAGWLPEGRPS